MYSQFISVKFLTKWLCAAILICVVSVASAQTAIYNGNGTTLTKFWCHDDTLHRIVGSPTGGNFDGCGVTEINGSWYFNPAVAAAGQTGGYHCFITYSPPLGNPISERIDIYNKIELTFWEDSIITCDGSFYLVADIKPVGPYIWNWSPGDQLDDSTQKGTGGTTDRDAYYVFSTVNTYNNCSQRDTVFVYYEGVRAEGSVAKETICVSEVVHFNADHQDPTYRYSWNSGDGVTGVGTEWQHAYIKPGTYDALLIVNNDHCSDTATIPVAVRDFTIGLSASSERVNRADALTLETFADETYQVTAWRPESLFGNQTAYTQHLSADTTRTYTVVGESAYGCVDSAEIRVDVNPVFFVPTSFTPNGDGRNDYFRVVNWGDPIVVTQFRVFDRWGREVWVGNGPNAFRGWDGTINGTPADMGSYYYVFEGQLPSGELLSEKGDVTLLR